MNFSEIDLQLFYLINHLPHPGWLDAIMLFLSFIGTAGIIWFVLVGIIFLINGKKDYHLLATSFLAGGLSWLITELLLKNIIARVRPSLEIGAIIVGTDAASNSFSMPSGHATISWAIAIILAKYEPRYRKYFYLLAILISFSRIYLGRHYPADVIVGGILGWGIGRIINELRIGANIRISDKSK